MNPLPIQKRVLVARSVMDHAAIYSDHKGHRICIGQWGTCLSVSELVFWAPQVLTNYEQREKLNKFVLTEIRAIPAKHPSKQWLNKMTMLEAFAEHVAYNNIFAIEDMAYELTQFDFTEPEIEECR